MAQDNLAFEWMIHIMELGVVLGIGVVVAFIKMQNKNKERLHKNQTSVNTSSNNNEA